MGPCEDRPHNPVPIAPTTRLALCVTGFADKGPPESRITHSQVYNGLARTNDELRRLGAARVDVFFNIDLNIYPQFRLSGAETQGKGGAFIRCPPGKCHEDVGYHPPNLEILGRMREEELTPAIAAVQPASVEYSNSTFCEKHHLCNSSCSGISARMPHRMWEQYARNARAYHQVLRYEREHGFRYTWVGRVRSDFVHIYWSSGIVSRAVTRSANAVLATNTAGPPGYGQIDLAALVPRAHADAYFLLPHTTCRWLSCVNSHFRDDANIKNERLLAEHIMSHGVAIEGLCDTVRTGSPKASLCTETSTNH
jgi:hypothetical protein